MMFKAIQFDQYGPASLLKVASIQEPELKPDEVLVKVSAASVNPLDWKIRSGLFRWIIPLRFPRGIGVDFSGTVEKVGAGVTDLKIGDEVFGGTNPFRREGSYAEKVVTTTSLVGRKPKEVPHREAATLNIAALSALQGLRNLGGIQPGHEVLILGASGGVGSFAVQVAKAMGAKVTGVCGPDNVQFVKELGADRVIDYTETDFTTLSEGFDIVYDVASVSSFFKCRKILKPRGVYINTLPKPDSILATALTLLNPGRKAKLLTAKGNRADLEFLASLVVKGRVRPVIEKVMPLWQASAAHEQSETGHTRGKIILEP